MTTNLQTSQAGKQLPLADNSLDIFQSVLNWYEFGFRVIPICPGSKKTAVKWDDWLHALSPEKIKTHWNDHPDHELGFIVGNEFVVFDSDTPESTIALSQIEDFFDVTPNLIVQTTKGEHHFFRMATNAYAKQDSHSTADYPSRIDVKTGRSLVILPPSTGKEIKLSEAEHSSELAIVEQDFIDAIFRNNGREVPRESVKLSEQDIIPVNENSKLVKLLEHLDPDSSYDDWIRVLMVIHQVTNGSSEGLAIADSWSRKGEKYKGLQEIQYKWKSFNNHQGGSVSLATLLKMLTDKGIDWKPMLAGFGEEFDVFDTEIVESSETKPNPMDKFSLMGRSKEVERNVMDSKPFLGNIALLGQATVIYAAPNTGKTLITLHLCIDAINNGSIEASKLYYLNVDDSAAGIYEKLTIAEEFGFHVLADGYQGFSVKQFREVLLEMIDNDQAKGVMIVLDTLKKFTSLMDKTASSEFNKVIRKFIAKGGTVVALAHTNKKSDNTGKPVYGGTSDTVDDFDCAFTLAVIKKEQGYGIVEFENIKRRGNVVDSVSYRYETAPDISYSQRLISVEQCSESDLLIAKKAEELKSDSAVVDAIQSCIKEGIVQKMKLAVEAGKRAKISKAKALGIIEKYTGTDPNKHHWNFAVKGRGAQVYELLNCSSDSKQLN